MLKRKMKPITAAVGTAFVATLASAGIANADSPFVVQGLDSGYDLLALGEEEGKCGEGKCGDSKGKSEGECGEGKCGEGKCGEGQCGEKKADGEGKCGEGSCGESMHGAPESDA